MVMELDRAFNPWEEQLGNALLDRESSHCGCGLANPCECAASKIHSTVCRCRIKLVLQAVLQIGKHGLIHDGIRDVFFCNPRAIVERLLVLLGSDWTYDDTYYKDGPVPCFMKRNDKFNILACLCACSCSLRQHVAIKNSVSCEQIHGEIENLPPRSLSFDNPGLTYLNGLTRMQFDRQYKLYLYFWTPRACGLFNPSLFEEFSDVDRFEGLKLDIDARHIKAMQPYNRGGLADSSSLNRKKQKKGHACGSNPVDSLMPFDSVLAPLEDFSHDAERDPSVYDLTQFETLNTDVIIHHPAAPVSIDREYSSGHQELSPLFDIGVLDEIINYDPATQEHMALPIDSAHDPRFSPMTRSTGLEFRHAAQDIETHENMYACNNQLQLQNADMMRAGGSLPVNMPSAAVEDHISDPATVYLSQHDFLLDSPQYAALFNWHDDETSQANSNSVAAADQDGLPPLDTAFSDQIGAIP